MDINNQMPQEIDLIFDKYNDIDELFNSMPEGLRRHSIRTAEYAVIIYEAALKIELNVDGKKLIEEPNRQFKNYLYLVAKYHDIGTMVLPLTVRSKHYNQMSRDEIRIYEMHPYYGAMLAEKFMVKQGGKPEIFWEMLINGARSHNEIPEGTGYEKKLEKEEVYISSQLLRLANMLDERTARLHVEDAFETGFSNLEKELTELGLNEFVLTIQFAKNRLKKIFSLHSYETEMVHTPPKIAKTRGAHPLLYKYRPVKDPKNDEIIAIEAKPIFYVSAKKEEMELDEVRPELVRSKGLNSVWKYFLYEACDMVSRINAFGYTDVKIFVPIFAGVGSQSKTVSMISDCLKEENVSPDKLCFLVDSEQLKKPAKTLLEVLEKIKGLGCRIMATDYELNDNPEEAVLSVGFNSVRLASSVLDHLDESTVGYLKELMMLGIKVYADGIDSGDYIEQMIEDKITGITGKEAGIFVTGDEIFNILDEATNK